MPIHRGRPRRRCPTRLLLVTLLLATAGLAGDLLAPAPAASQTGGGEEPTQSIGGRIHQDDRGGIAGVRLEVSQGGQMVGAATTGPDGEWSVGVPEAGTYAVALIQSTLPEGVSLRDPDRSTLGSVDVRTGQAKVVLFPLGERESSGTSRLSRFLNLVVDGLKLGAVVAVASVGLSLVFGVTGLVNFAHGELVTFGAVVAYLFSSAASGPEMPLILAAAVAVVVGGGLGLTLERGLWRPLRHRRTNAVALLVISIGLSMFLRHIILAIFDGAPRQYTEYTIQQPVKLGAISVLPKEMAVIAIAAVVLSVVGLLLRLTRTGTAIRAVADNPDLAETSGIDVERVLAATWVGATALTALGGVLYGVTQAVVWNMGQTLLLTMFAAVLLGGLGSAFGAAVGGLMVGLFSEVSTYWIPVELKSVVALAVLVAVLLLRPQGVLGTRERIA